MPSVNHSLAARHVWEALLAERRDLAAALGILGAHQSAQLEGPFREVTGTISALGQLLGLDEPSGRLRTSRASRRDREQQLTER